MKAKSVNKTIISDELKPDNRCWRRSRLRREAAGGDLAELRFFQYLFGDHVQLGGKVRVAR
jgi:hypothetical protein